MSKDKFLKLLACYVAFAASSAVAAPLPPTASKPLLVADAPNQLMTKKDERDRKEVKAPTPVAKPPVTVSKPPVKSDDKKGR